MIEEGWLQSKCNRCGDIFKTVHCPDVRRELLELIQTQYPLPGLHSCTDGGTGICELVGYILDPEGE